MNIIKQFLCHFFSAYLEFFQEQVTRSRENNFLLIVQKNFLIFFRRCTGSWQKGRVYSRANECLLVRFSTILFQQNRQCKLVAKLLVRVSHANYIRFTLQVLTYSVQSINHRFSTSLLCISKIFLQLFFRRPRPCLPITNSSQILRKQFLLIPSLDMEKLSHTSLSQQHVQCIHSTFLCNLLTPEFVLPGYTIRIPQYPQFSPSLASL